MRAILLILFFGAGLALGFWLGTEPSMAVVKEGRAGERKSFVFVVYGCNCSPWCERALRSIFEQEYDAYRLVWIDDASTDTSLEQVQNFILENNQDAKAIVMRNEVRLGRNASYERCMGTVGDAEVAVLLEGANWMATNEVLNRLNLCFQDPRVAFVLARGLFYPSYEQKKEGLAAFYGSLARNGARDEGPFSIERLQRKAEKGIARLPDILQFVNQSALKKEPD